MTSRLRSVPRHCCFVAAFVTALSATVLSLNVTPAAAEPVLDANCFPQSTNATGGVISADQRIAQTFTAQATGSLVRGEILIRKPADSSGNWVMEIYATDGAGAPTNTVLASTTIPDATVPNGISNLVGAFAPGASVQAGQQYALSLTRSAGWEITDLQGNLCPGSEFFSTTLNGSWTVLPSFDLSFRVFVEPASSSEPEPDLAAPDTSITKGPPDKTKKKQATFEFSSSEPGSTFECSLDGGAFAPCSSPSTLKVKKGKHTFSVRAIDAAANADGSPATDDWKVKKKKKK